MIILHKSLKRSDAIIKSLQSYFSIDFKSVDGIVEMFNNANEQGFILKIYRSYNRDNDLVIWIYESLKNMNIQLGYSNMSNVDENNNWIDKNKINFKVYPIVKNIKPVIINETVDNIIKYYNLDVEIEKPKGIYM